MSDSFSIVCKLYFEREKGKKPETDITYTDLFCDAIKESSINLTHTQVELMWSILTPKEQRIIEESFKKAV